MLRNERVRILLFAIKISGVLALLIGITQHWGDYYVEALLPLYRAVIDWILPDYHVLSLTLSQQQAEPVVAAHLITIKDQLISGHALPTGVTLDASTLADHALKHVIIVLAGILLWPDFTLKNRAFRLLLAIPLIVLLEMIDIPFAIAGAVQDVVFFNLSSDYATHKPLLVSWLHLLDGGGRLALSVLVALSVNVMPLPIVKSETELPSEPCVNNKQSIR